MVVFIVVFWALSLKARRTEQEDKPSSREKPSRVPTASITQGPEYDHG
jgi:hypothetical protein